MGISKKLLPHRPFAIWLLALVIITFTAIYWPGLSGSWLFDDYPNIVDNQGVQPANASISSLINAALSSPSSEFKRPLASLSFAANYLAAGLNPYWWKLTNLLIHLLNGLFVFVLARALLRSAPVGAHAVREKRASTFDKEQSRTRCAPTGVGSSLAIRSRMDFVAALIAAGWMLLPINLTGVLYVVQRMESMANLFVLLGLIGYIAGRRRMLDVYDPMDSIPSPARKRWAMWSRFPSATQGLILCVASITFPTALGVLAKETAVMLPLYALLMEWLVFGFCAPCITEHAKVAKGRESDPYDKRIVAMFLVMLALPIIAGLLWLLPGLLKPDAWATRDFSLGTRLLSEARIIVDYVVWTLLPTPGALSFYHDDFQISSGLLAPASTLASIVLLAALIALMFWLRHRRPLVALGVALFLGCQLLTGTILPLELIYEHRNYFASFGLMLAVIPMLAAAFNPATVTSEAAVRRGLLFARFRHALLGALIIYWTVQTALTAYAWGDPLRLAKELASRAPESPRAQYELGRTYIIESHYDPASPFTALAYAPLEHAANLPGSSILPQQALIFMNSRMHLPLKDTWWDSMIAKLKVRDPGVQDESSLAALTQCARERHCDLPARKMEQAFAAALAHPNPTARLFATYGDYAWNVMDEHELGERMTAKAVRDSPSEPAYRITLIRMLVAMGRKDDASMVLRQLETLNIGGRLNNNIAELRRSLSQH